MATFSPPEPLDFTKPSTWPDWKQRFSRYRDATELMEKQEGVQVSALIYSMGAEAEHIFKSFTFTDAADANKYAPVLAKFDDHFVPRRNVIFERAKFRSRVQQPGESVEAFIRQLYELAENCDFGALKEEQMRDSIVIGLRDRLLSQKLQMKEDLTLRSAIEMARHYELIKGQNQQQPCSSDNVDEVKSFRQRGKRDYGTGAAKAYKQRKDNIKRKCGKCHREHSDPEECPAKGKRCNKCKKLGHFAIACYTKSVREITTNDHGSELDEDESVFLGSLTEDKTNVNEVITEDEPPWHTILNIANTPVTFKIDSGADTSVITEATYNSLAKKPKLKPVRTSLGSPGGAVTTRGQFMAKIQAEVQNKLCDCHFRVVVVRSCGDNLLGRAVATKLGLIRRVNEVSVFGDVGTLKGDPVRIVLKEGAKPYSVATPRRVPIPLLPKVEEELKRMESMGIIEKVTQPTQWCAPMVPVVKRNTKIRICVDLKKLNESVEREKFILPTIDDLLPKLAGSTVFSSLDAASGFWQIPLEEDCALLTTFITPLGRYCFKRLPFGITSAPEIFQRKMTELLQGHEGVIVYMDDILVFGETKQQHDMRLRQVMESIKKSGLKLNKEKCKLSQSKLDFLGHVVSKDGIMPNPARVAAIRNMSAPKNIPELRRFLGMVNYIGRYLSNLSTCLQPLNDLLKSDREWTWGPQQEKAFTDVKTLISSAPALAYFDPQRPTVVSADASSYGLGGLIMQEHDGILKPVAFCSRTLTDAERRYAQIEKECLAGVWASERFYQYLCGLESYQLFTDHKPLVTLINSKDLDTAPLRCQRLLIRLMKFNPIAVYVPGKNLVAADALSRHPLQSTETDDLEKEVQAYVNAIEESIGVRRPVLEQIKERTETDNELQRVLSYIKNGWPDHIKSIAISAKPYFRERGMLSELNGVLRRGNQIVVPRSMRDDMIQKIHQGHQGLTKCRQRYNNAIWWPGIGHDVRELIQSCRHCNINRPSQHREPLLTTPLPELPWQKIAADLCEYKGRNYLVIIDYFSRWLEILHLPKTNSETVIGKMKSTFSRWGIPEEVRTDNGPQFSAELFKKFAEEYDFQHITSSPHFPQANGMAERGVKTAKGILKQDDPHLALLCYRSTPTEPTGESPAKLMMGRSLRTTLPTLKENLKPAWPDLEKVRQNDKQAKQSYERFYNRRYSAKPLPPLTCGDQVRLKIDGEKTWATTAVVQHEEATPRSFTLQTSRGDTPRRNRRNIQLVNRETSVEPPAVPPEPAHTVPVYPESSTTQPVSSHPAAGPVVTRSGRVVKPNRRYVS